MVGNVTIQGQIVGTATFDGAKISAVVTIAPPINATVVFGKSGVTVHNELTGRDAIDVHPKESITGLGLTDSPEFANTKITTLDSVANGGVIPNNEATWLGATAKNVLSYLQKLVSEVFSIDGRVSALENLVIADFVTTSTLTTIDVTGLNFVDGDRFSVEVIGTSSTSNSLLVLSLNNIKTAEYWYTGTTAYVGFFGICSPFYRNRWDVSVNGFNCLCRTDHSRGDLNGLNFVTATITTMTKPVSLGGNVIPPITIISITGGTNAIAVGTRIIVRKL